MDIFISYARKDLARVAPIAQALGSLGYSVWWDANLRAGRRFHLDIERELTAARCVLVVWTEAAVLSDWVYAEAMEALAANKLLPVFLEAVKPPLYFRHVHGVDISGWDGRLEHDQFQRLLRDCAELAPQPAPQSPPEPRETKARGSDLDQGSGDQPPAVIPAGTPESRPGTAAPQPPRPRRKERADRHDEQGAVPDPSTPFRDRLKDGSEGPEMLWLPAGTFLMGSPADDAMAYDDERPQHEVRIARPFAIGRFPVTFADYDRFCVAAKRDLPDDQGWGRDRRPVINVSWYDARAYCLWLTEQTGQDYRLPSEAEWEYACRAGTPTQWSFGDDAGALGEYAWFNGNSGGQTHPVGEKRPNPWGLHDMHGNVWEWVQDHWHGNYQGAPADGCAWEDASGGRRVLRGGSWILHARDVRSAYRLRRDPGSRSRNVGFRLVLGPQPKPGAARHGWIPTRRVGTRDKARAVRPRGTEGLRQEHHLPEPMLWTNNDLHASRWSPANAAAALAYAAIASGSAISSVCSARAQPMPRSLKTIRFWRRRISSPPGSMALFRRNTRSSKAEALDSSRSPHGPDPTL